MLKDESLQRQSVDDTESFAGTEIPPRFDKGSHMCACLWEEVIGTEQ